MKAAILTTLNAPLELWDIEPAWQGQDRVCGPSQALVEMRVSGICGSQLKEISGEKFNKDYLPHMLGHEGCGIVRDVGPGVNVQMKGKKVVCHWRKGEGSEAFHTARYETAAGRTVGGGHVTTLCESAVVSANRLTVVPDDVPDELCALLGCGLSTALGTIEQEAKVKFGESVLIVGCGGVGLNLIQAAKLACAWPIFTMDLNSDKLETVAKLGAHAFCCPRSGMNPKVAMADYGIKGFDVIVDTSGSIEALEATIPLLGESGRYIMVGQPKPGEEFRVLSTANMFAGEGKRIQATQGGGFRPTQMITRYVNLWRAGLLDLDSIISHRIGLSEINEGIELVRKGQAGRVLVEMR